MTRRVVECPIAVRLNRTALAGSLPVPSRAAGGPFSPLYFSSPLARPPPHPFFATVRSGRISVLSLLARSLWIARTE